MLSPLNIEISFYCSLIIDLLFIYFISSIIPLLISLKKFYLALDYANFFYYFIIKLLSLKFYYVVFLSLLLFKSGN
jgi:hypothetical protein